MEFISQDKEMTMPSSLLYSSAIRDSSSTKHLSSGNGTKTLNPSQKFDQDQPLRKGKDPSPDPDPDPVPVSISLPTKKNVNPSLIFRYRECLKNHAASIGGHVIDGCGEFMPSSEEDSPDALKCAACNCHRNFHRKELPGEPRSYSTPNRINRNPYHSQIPPPLHLPSLHHQNHKFQLGLPTSPVVPIQPMMMAFGGGGGGGGGGTESSSDELNVFQSGAGARPPELQSVVLSKKRFRTKFSQEQKDRMLEFADKVGWRIQKQDEPSVQQFCDEVGVKRQVLKVWMHNNKHILKKGGNVSLGKHNIDS